MRRTDLAEVRRDDAAPDELHVGGGERLAEEDVGVERVVRADDHLLCEKEKEKE